MAKTYDEYMAMAAKAHEAGQPDHARQLVALAKQARETQAAQARSEAMGGPFVPEAEQKYLDFQTLQEAKRQQESIMRGYPTFLAPPPSKVTAAEEAIKAREAVAAPGAEAEEPYSEAIKGMIPMLRPTRISEQYQAPLLEPVRLYRDPDTGELRPPTATEELIEAFARQPVLTESAARALAAGAKPEEVQKKIGPLEGAVIESPFQATMRALPASVLAPAIDVYREAGGRVKTEEPIPATGAGIGKMFLESLATDLETSPTLAAYIRKASEFGPEIERKLIEKGVSAARAATGVLERVAGQEPGSTPLAQELATLGVPQPVIPAPRAIPYKPISQRIREGETVATLIRDDPKSAMVYDREFGVLAPIAPHIVSFAVEAPLPFTPLGVVTKGAKVTGLAAKASKAAEGALTARAMKQAEGALANRLYSDFVGAAPSAPLKTLDDARRAITSEFQDPLLISRAPDAAKLDQAFLQAQRDLARVAPSTDLVRVSPNYAVPKALAAKVTREAAADVKTLRSQAQRQGRALTQAEEAAARDVAVARAAQSEARKLDELGQFQVLLDGLDTPRAWDTTLFRAAQAYKSPEAAMKRAAVVAAEEEVARKGQEAIRLFRKEVEARSKAGESVDDILEAVGKRELAAMPPEELFKKVLEEAYGGPTAAAIFERAKDVPLLRGSILRPDRARELHAELIANKVIEPSLVSPNFAANAVKIIMEEGVRKRVSKEALETFKAAYPDIAKPTLAIGEAGKATEKALLAERQFFENGAEELFKLADQIPTRAQGASLDVQQASERVASAVRNARQKVRVPLAAEVELLAGEVAAAPIRAYLNARYALPVIGEKVGVNTPYGYLKPADLDRMIEGLGGFGPSRMDVKRRGLMVQDILLAASGSKTHALKDLAFGRPYAYAQVDAIEEAFRRGTFYKALQEGRTPEAAMTLARRSQFDYGAADQAIVQALAPYWGGAVNTMAAGSEFVDRMAKNPQAYSAYLRALRKQQEMQDPEGLQGDLPLSRFYTPVPEGATKDVFGRPLDLLGPNAPGLEPLDVFLGVAKTVQAASDVTQAIVEDRILDAALDGSVDALDEVAAKFAAVSAGFGGEERQAPKTVKRTGAGPTIDQTYMATFAIGKALGMQRAAERLLSPQVVKPPKQYQARDIENEMAWNVRPPDAPDAFVYSENIPVPGTEGQTRQVWYLIKPSKEGRQRIQALGNIPGSDVVGRGTRAVGTWIEKGLPEGALWYIGAETVEEPLRQAVEQVR